MTKPQYYEAKPVAQAALGRIFDTNDARVATGDVQFEPNQGFVAILVLNAGAYGADFIEQGFEVQYLDGKGFGQTDVKPAKAPKDPSAPSGPVSAPTKGVTAQVWSIADTVLNEKGQADRAAIMKLCEAAGINSATAGTQYSKWKRARGL